MPEYASRRGAAVDRIQAEIAARLRKRRGEIAAEILAQVEALPGLGMCEDPEYLMGLRETVAEVLDFGIEGIEIGDDVRTPVPLAALAQARRAARVGVGLDAVLRRYVAGERKLVEFILEAAGGVPSGHVQQVLRWHAARVDRLMAAVAAEHAQESERIERSSDRDHLERVQRLLAGEVVDARRLEYEIENWHLGLVIQGENAKQAARKLALKLHCQLLAVSRGPDLDWAWLGSTERIAAADVQQMAIELDQGIQLALGEARNGLRGWRLTHYEALAGFQVMTHRPQTFVRGGDAVLLAAILRDTTLVASLEESYVAPLRGRNGEDRELRETLREYFRAGGNAATAAAALGVDRHTVKRRLHKIEERVGRSVHSCHAELEIALNLAEFRDDPPVQANEPKPLAAPS